jgi:hypothetical protein
VADPSVLDDRPLALRQGYYFEPMSARFETLFAVAKAQLALPQQDAQAWLDEDPLRRTPWLEQGDLRTSAALLVLEEAALRRQQLQLRDALKRKLLGGGDPQYGQALEQVRQWLRDGEFLSRPAAMSSVGYGLPQAEERGQLQHRLTQLSARQQDGDQEMRELARRWLPEVELGNLEAAEANVAMIGERVRALATE